MKRIIAMALVVLMLLPVFASYIFAITADDVVITDEPQNVAGVGTIETPSEYNWDSWENGNKYLIDGNKETGTYSPRGASTNFTLNLGKEFYISEIVFVFNGKGELVYEEETIDNEIKDVKRLQIVAYDKDGKSVYESELLDVTNLTEHVAEVNGDVVTVDVKILPTNGDYCSLWELEVYAVNPPPRCDAEGTNIASEALLNATYRKRVTTKDENGKVIETTYVNEPTSWWAMDLSKMIDGDINTGTQTVKSSEFSLWMYFGKEHFFSDIVVHCNGRGYLSSGDVTEDFIDPETKKPAVNENEELTGPIVYRSYLLTVIFYDFNDEIVYQSEIADVSGLTEFKVNAGVSAATVEFKVSQAGAAGQSGAIYFWDVEANEGTGSHMYKEIDRRNPVCGIDGYILEQCQDEECGARRTTVLPSTGYHVWNDGEEKLEATNEANGVKTHTCTICGNKTDRDIPALGHNFVVDEVVEPYCEVGYTKYKCSDAGCNLTYIGNYTKDNPLGHRYDDGVIAKKATINEEGKMIFTCQRAGCGHTFEKILRKAKYIDNTVKVDNSIVTKYEAYQTIDKTVSENAYEVLAPYVFDGITDNGKHGLNSQTNYWFSPGEFEKLKDENGEVVKDDKGNAVLAKDENGNLIRNSGFLYIYLDKEYYFTKGMVYAAANYKWFEIHFQYQNEDGEWVTSASYVHDRLNNLTVSGLDMTPKLNFGAKASRIVIESVNGDCGWTYGQVPEGSPNMGGRLQIHELVLEAHECEFTPEDYEDESKWNMPTCTTDGSCQATCAVCGQQSTIVLDNEGYGHNYGEVTVLEHPTCSEVGAGIKQCTICNYELNVDVPATGEHEFENEHVHIPPTCSEDGVGQKVCKYCMAPDYNYSIRATGEHIYDYITKSTPNYTAVGKTIYACIYCEKQGEGADKIEEKLEIPKEFVTFLGYDLRMTGYLGIRANFKFDRDILNELERTCDVTITVKATNLITGKVLSAQAYGKQVHYSGQEKFNENDEFSAVAKVANCSSEFKFTYEVKLVNFRGTEIVEYDVPPMTTGEDGVTVKEIAADILTNSKTIRESVKKFLEEIIAE